MHSDRPGRWPSSATAALLALLLAGCAAGGAATQPIETPGTAATPGDSPRLSSSPAPTASSAGVPGCPNFVEVVETAPMPSDGPERDVVVREHQRIAQDADVAQQYGAEHPDEFASLRFENGPRVRLVIAFTDHLAEHCAALRELLAFPDEFELIRLKWTESELFEIQEEITALARPFFLSAGWGGARDRIEVSLRADGEDVARQLVERYGDLVDVTVGLMSFPERSRPDGLTTCQPAYGSPKVDSALRASLVLESDVVSSGADFRGTVTVMNAGTGKVDFESGSPLTALVYQPGGSEAIGTFSGAIGGVGIGEVLGRRETIDIDVIGGTASCDPALGYALPPGSYEARAVVDVLTSHRRRPTDIEYILSDPAPLTIVP